MRLTTLEPYFLRYEPRDGAIYHRMVESIVEAQGVMFLCPKCFETNKGNIGTHSVLCWSRSAGVPDSASPGPGRWKLVGSSLLDLTLDADPPNTARSVLLTKGCGWHGFVTNGEVE
jgi:hypothetical protein